MGNVIDFQRKRCPKCNNFGIAETLGVNHPRSVASYCDCPAGQERRARANDYFSPAKINAARKILAATNAKTKPTGTDDGYQGEF